MYREAINGINQREESNETNQKRDYVGPTGTGQREKSDEKLKTRIKWDQSWRMDK